MQKQRIYLVSVIYALTACTTSHPPAPETTPSFPQPALPTTTPTAESSGPWIFAPPNPNHAYRYRSRSSTTIYESPAPRLRVDTIRLDTYFTISLNPLPSSMTIAGHIDSLTINSNPIDKNEIKLPVAFTGRVMTKTLILKASESQPQCTSPAATILGEIRSIIVPYPSPLFLTSTWKDSLSTATCSSAQVPTLLESVSSYQVTGKATNRLSQALVIQRVDSTHFAGHGTQNQHELEVTGIGVTLSSIYLDINTGTITLVDTHEKTNIIIRVSGQERRFIQEVRQRVDLLP